MVTVAGEPQRWRIIAEGAGVDYIAYHDATGQNLQQRPALAERAQLDDFFLLPGPHWLRVRANDGDYTLRFEPLGADGLQVDEREPNDDISRGHLLQVDGPAQRGRTATPEDDDRYRFYLAAPGYVRLLLTSPDDGEAALDLDGYFNNVPAPAGETLALDLLLPAGDHFLNVEAVTPSEGAYAIAIERLNPLDLPADLEPTNNEQQGSQPLPSSLVLNGQVGAPFDSYDWFQLPSMATDATMSLASQGDLGRLRVFDASGDGFNGTLDSTSGKTLFDLPANEAHALRVAGDGPYTLTLSFDPVIAAQELPPLPVSLELAAESDTLAGFWHNAQKLILTLTLRNDGDVEQSLDLEAVTSSIDWTPALASNRVTLAPGESLALPLHVNALADLRTDASVQLSVRARNDAGQQAFASTELFALCGAPPINPNRTWTSAGALFRRSQPGLAGAGRAADL